MANGTCLTGHNLKKSVGNAYLPQSAIRRQIAYIDSMRASAQRAFYLLEMERTESEIAKTRESLADLREGLRSSQSFGQSTSPELREKERMLTEKLETLEIRYQAKPCEHTPFEGVALDDHVASVQAHNNRFNNSSGHRYGHSAAWKKPRKRRAGTGYSFRPEIPSLPAGAGNVFFSEDGCHPELGNVWDLEQLSRYSRAPGSHPEQTVPKIEWAVERDWRNRTRRRRKVASRKIRGTAAELEVARKEVIYYSEPGLSPPKNCRSGWW